MTIDIVSQINSTLEWVNMVRSTQKGSTGDQQACDVNLYSQAFRELDNLRTNTSKKANETYQKFSAFAAQAAAVESFIQAMAHFNKVTEEAMIRNFSPGIAKRALGQQ